MTLEQAELKDFQIDIKLALIAVDEYSLGFGGAGNELVSLLASSDSYEAAQPEPAVRFKLM